MLPYLRTLLLAMTPINELRGTIPLALTVYKLSPIEAFGWAVIGNILPVLFLLWFWPSLAKFLMERFSLFNKFFNWLFKRTYARADKKMRRWGYLGLVLFVAIPLPMTGAWTGSIVAFLFNIPYSKALGLISLGVVLAGIIVTLASTGILSFIKII